MSEEIKKIKEEDDDYPVPFSPKEVFNKWGNFQVHSLGFPTNENRAAWTHKAEKEFEPELEDLMRKYKIVQVTATIFSKL